MTRRQRIAEIKARVEAATPAPWMPSTDEPGDVVIWGPREDWLANIGNWARQRDLVGEIDPDVSARQYVELRDANDAAFIAAARQDVPWLLDELHQAREALQAFMEYRFLCSDIPGATARLDAALMRAEDMAFEALKDSDEV